MKHLPLLPLFLATFCHASIAAELTLPNAFRLMLEYEPELNAAEYDTLSSMENIKVFRSERLPQGVLRGTTGVSDRDRSIDGLARAGATLFQRQLGFSLRQLLFDGGVARNNENASENAMLAQQYLEKSMIEKRAVDLAEVYLELLRIGEQLSLGRQNVSNHEKMVSLINKKVDNGGFRSEARLAESRLSRAQHLLSALENDRERAGTRFERLIGQSCFELCYPPLPPIPQSIDKVSLEDNWDYLAASEALEEAEHRAKAARSQYMPKVFLDAGYSVGRDVSGFPGQDDEASALIVGQWTLFDGGKRKAVEQREHFQVGKFEELKRAADLARHHDLELIWQNREANSRSISILSSYKTDLEEVVGDYEQRFAMGREELLNILDMQAEHHGAASDLIDAKYDHAANSFRIYGQQGRLAEWLLRLAGQSTVAGSAADSKNPQKLAVPVALGAAETLKDQREPLTQKELMLRVFDGEGPTAEYEPSPAEKYYEVETPSRKGLLGRMFSARNKSIQTAESPAAGRQPKVSTRSNQVERPVKR